MKNIKVNWIHVFKEHIESMRKMGFIKVGDKWVSKEEEQVAPSREDQSGTNDGQQAAPNAGNQYEPE